MEETTPDNKLTKKTLIFLAGVIATCILLWIFLVPTQWNEGLYTNNATLYTIARILTELGSENAYIVIFLIFFLAIDNEYARSMVINFTLTGLFGNFFKLWFQDPRPAGNLVGGEVIEESYGFPSGHTYSTVSIWGYTALNTRAFPKKKTQTGIKILAGILLVVIPLTRLILGVHDLQDVLGGYILGFVIISLYMFMEPIVREQNWKLGKKIGLGIIGSLILWGILSGILALLHPEDFLHQVEELAQGVGLLIGFSIALPLEIAFVHYDPKHLPIIQKILGTLLGLILVLGVYLGLSMAFKPLPAQYILRAVRYCLLAIMGGLGAPWLLTKIFKR